MEVQYYQKEIMLRSSKLSKPLKYSMPVEEEENIVSSILQRSSIYLYLEAIIALHTNDYEVVVPVDVEQDFLIARDPATSEWTSYQIKPHHREDHKDVAVALVERTDTQKHRFTS